jgi:hypothetical protein
MNEGQIYDSELSRAVRSKRIFYSRLTGATSDVGSHLTNLFRHSSFISQFSDNPPEVK